MRDQTARIVELIEPAINEDHYAGTVENVREYYGNDEDPDVTVDVGGEFAAIHRAVQAITSDELMTVAYIVHNGVDDAHTRIAVDTYDPEKSGQTFTGGY